MLERKAKIIIKHSVSSDTPERRAQEAELVLEEDLPDDVLRLFQRLVGRFVQSVTYAESDKAVLKRWQVAVANGETVKGFAEWRDDGCEN